MPGLNERTRVRVFVSGRVQGVWFRESCRDAAASAGVCGWVRNLSDGRVEAVLEGPPAGDPVMRVAFLMLQALDGFENTRDHAAGRLPAMLVDAGFSEPTTLDRLRTIAGTLELLCAQVPQNVRKAPANASGAGSA